MGYSGQTYAIDCSKGGWNANPNIDTLPPEAMTNAQNINLHLGGRTTRGGIDNVNAVAITGAPQIMGVYQFVLNDGTSSVVTATAGGKIYTDYTTELATGLSSNKYTNFESFMSAMYACNGADVPQLWDGAAASTSALAADHLPTDWTGTNYPKQMITHGRGLSQRLWGYGCPSNLEKVYASSLGTDDFSDDVVKTFNIPGGANAAIEFGERLIFFGSDQSYILDDTDVDTANWGITKAIWKGGAAHERVVCLTPNDVIVMSPDMDIFSLMAVQEYGDYKLASLTRPAFINKWIDDNIDKAQINKFHMVYDPALRAVKIFVVRTGQTKCDTALVYFIDRPPLEAWVRHTFDNDFASCSAVVNKSVGITKVYTGGHDGFVYELETTAKNDAGVYFYNGFTTPYLTFDNPRVKKRYDRGWVIIVPQGTETISINLSIDGVLVTGGYFVVDENGNYLVDESGNFIFGNSDEVWTVTASTSSTLQNLSYDMGSVGGRIQAEVFNTTINDDMFVSQLLFDFKPLGAKPQ